MNKEEIIETIKNNIEYYMLQSEIDAYITAFLDALCATYEITYDEREEIEEMINEQDNK